MAFDAGNFNAAFSLRARAEGTQTWKYDGGSDTVATMVAADYFADEYQRLSVGDFINITHATGTTVLEVLTSAVTGVTSTQHGKGINASGGTITITQALHDGKTILFDTAAGTVMTLPAATGTGAKFRCVVSILATSNSHVLQCVGTDMMQGACGIIDTDTADATIQFAALVGDTFDTVTMNRTTTGLGAPGDYVEVEDIVAGVYAVRGVIRANGAVATPFSSAV